MVGEFRTWEIMMVAMKQRAEKIWFGVWGLGLRNWGLGFGLEKSVGDSRALPGEMIRSWTHAVSALSSPRLELTPS